MAKKTKKDKAIAKLRFQLTNTQQELEKMREEIASLKGEKPRKQTGAEEVKKASIKAKKQLPKKQEGIWEYSPSLIKKDLLKTLALSTLAIVLELVLYWFNLPK